MPRLHDHAVDARLRIGLGRRLYHIVIILEWIPEYAHGKGKLRTTGRAHLRRHGTDLLHGHAGTVPAVTQGDGPAPGRGRHTTHPDRYLATRLRQGADTLQRRGDNLWLIDYWILGPAGPQDIDDVVGPRAPIIKGHAHGVELTLHPTHASAQNQAALAQQIQGRQFLGQMRWNTQGQHQHRCAQFYSASRRRGPGQGNQWFIEAFGWRIGRIMGNGQMIVDPDTVKAKILGLARAPAYSLRPCLASDLGNVNAKFHAPSSCNVQATSCTAWAHSSRLVRAGSACCNSGN